MKVSLALSLTLTRRQKPACSWQTLLFLQDLKWYFFIFNMEQNQTLMPLPFGRREFSILGQRLALHRIGERWFLWNVPCTAIFPASLDHAGSPALLPVGSGLRLFILCPTLLSHDKNLLGRSVRHVFFKNWHCCKGCWVILSFYAHKTHSQMWVYVQWPPTTPVFVELWLHKISPSLCKMICGIFLLSGTSEVKMSVLSLPLQTGNHFFWRGL